MNISIIGNGNMAKGIGTRLVAGGHTVNVHAHTPEKAETLVKELGSNATVKELGSELDDVVVLAVGYDAIDDVAKEYEGRWDGKTVIDITNPVDFKTFQLIPAPGTAGAEEIAKKLSGAKVTKAFNTAFAHTLVAGQVGGQPLDIFIAGDDEEAKKTVTQLIADGKMRAIDAGALANARHLEGFALIHMAIQTPMDLGFSSAIKVLS